MSFLNINRNSFAALPKSCQSSIRRSGRCTCPSCSSAALTSSSSSNDSRMWSIFSHANDRGSSGSSDNSSSNATESRGLAGGEHDVSEGHMLTILSEINKMVLEREVAEARCATFFESVDCCERGCKRTRVSFEEGGRQEEEGESGVPRDVEPMVEVILERRKLVPVSRRKQAGGRVQGERNKGRLERLGRRLRALGSSGKKKFLMALHKYWIEELI